MWSRRIEVTALKPRSKSLRLVAGVALALIAAIVAAPFVILGAVDAGRLDALIQREASRRTGRPIRFERLHASLLSMHPRVVVDGLVIGDPVAMGSGRLAEARRVTADLDLAPLLVGHVQAKALTIDAPTLTLVRHGPGRDNWSFGHGASAKGPLANVERLTITGGRFTMDDTDRGLKMAGTFASAGAGPRPFVLDATGERAAEPFTVKARGAALNGPLQPGRYGFDAEMVDGATVLDFGGTTLHPLDLRGFDFRLNARGPNLADLRYVLKVTAPNSAPYRLTGRLTRAGHRVELTGLSATIGGSDFAGQLISDREAGAGPVRHSLAAVLRSERLRLEDVRTMLRPAPPHAQTRSVSGGAPEASKADAAHGAGARKPGGLFSDSPFQVKRLEATDASLRLTARRFEGLPQPVSNLSADVTLQDRRVEARALTFALGAPGAEQGRVTVRAALDMRPAVPDVAFAMQLRSRSLAAVSPAAAKVARAPFSLWIDMRGRGASMKAAAAAAQGRASFVLGAAEVGAMQEKALSGDLVGAAFAKLRGAKSQAPLRCVVGDLEGRDGILAVRRLAAVSDDGSAEGSGGIDLRAQTVDILLKPISAHRRLFGANAPVRVSGPLVHPSAKIEAGPGTLLQALIPFASPNAAPPDCRALTAEAEAFTPKPR